MRIDIVSLFPEMFDGPFGQSMIKRAVERGILDIHLTNPRDFAYDKHRVVDDAPFGGGDGMVLKPEPIFRSIRHIKARRAYEKSRVVLMCPSGRPFTQEKAKELADYEQLILICGHYEGFDARVSEHLADDAVSIGDYVLTGGELPAMVVVDAVSRMLPGVLGSAGSATSDSFYTGLLKYPQYTRPREFEQMVVPDILLSGNHAHIERWRRRESLKNTLKHRPDLLEKARLSAADKAMLDEIRAENE